MLCIRILLLMQKSASRLLGTAVAAAFCCKHSLSNARRMRSLDGLLLMKSGRLLGRRVAVLAAMNTHSGLKMQIFASMPGWRCRCRSSRWRLRRHSGTQEAEEDGHWVTLFVEIRKQIAGNGGVAAVLPHEHAFRYEDVARQMLALVVWF